MMKWLDLGMSDPLTLGMAHPLADRLECLSTPKLSKSWSRSLTCALLLVVGGATAPLTVASEHPETELEESVVKGNTHKIHRHTSTVTHNGDSHSEATIEVHREDDGQMHKFEIHLDGDTFRAFKVLENGGKKQIPMRDIQGFNAQKAKDSKSWSFDVNDDNQLVFRTGKDVTKYHAKHGSHKNILRFKGLEGLENLKGLEKLEALKALEGLKGLENLSKLEGLSKLSELSELSDMEGVFVFENLVKDGRAKTFKWSGDMPEFPEPPTPPNVTIGENDIVISRSFSFSEDGDHKGYPRLELKSKDGGNYVFHHGNSEEISKRARLSAAKAMLENAEDMLNNLEGEDGELDRARKDLKKAQKSLRDAEKKLEKK